MQFPITLSPDFEAIRQVLAPEPPNRSLASRFLVKVECVGDWRSIDDGGKLR